MQARFNLKLAAAALACCAGAAAHAEAVTMTGSWVADFSAAMAETPQASTTVFQFQGSHKLALARRTVYVLSTCVGMETATKEADGTTSTKGRGRCELKDHDGDKILASMETAFDGFMLVLQGGTGKWQRASGRIVSKETFTLETERQLKGYSDAKGDVSLD